MVPGRGGLIRGIKWSFESLELVGNGGASLRIRACTDNQVHQKSKNIYAKQCDASSLFCLNQAYLPASKEFVSSTFTFGCILFKFLNTRRSKPQTAPKTRQVTRI